MKWYRRLKWMRFSRVAIIVSLILTVVFAAFTVYGSNAGNFTVNTSQSTAMISLSMVEDRSDRSTRLTVDPPDHLSDHTLNRLQPSIINGIGNKSYASHNKYIAFSFYLINESGRDISYDMEMKITAMQKNIAGALRVMVIEGDDVSLFPGRIYAMPETSVENEMILEEQKRLQGYDTYEYPYTTVDFVEERVVLQETVDNFLADNFTKYTIVLWLEGCDADCVDEIQGGGAKIELNFYAF